MKTPIYLDHAATTPLRKAAKETLLAHVDDFGNPSSVHQAGQRARHLLDGARRDLAELFGLRGEQVVFTSGGTEANNLALRGVMSAAEGKRLLVSPTEHSCVLNTAKTLEEQGVPVTWLKVNANGEINLEHLESELTQGNVALVSIHTVNNETGVQVDCGAVRILTKKHGALFHTDAVQAPLAHKGGLKADLITISGHKFGGLKGAGALLIQGNPAMHAQITGGAQERNRRAGTEPLLPILTQTAALKEYAATAEEEYARHIDFGKKVEGFCEAHESVSLVAASASREAHIMQLHLHDKTGEDMVMGLDMRGIAVSQGSACTSGRTEPSHVLQAMGYTSEEAAKAIRISFGHTTIEADIDALLSALKSLL